MNIATMGMMSVMLGESFSTPGALATCVNP